MLNSVFTFYKHPRRGSRESEIVVKMAERRVRRPRIFRERKDILNMYNDAELIKRYRLDREGILLVTDFVRDAITPATSRSRAIPAELKVLTTLRYLATGKMQLCNGDDLGITQQAASKVITETLDALLTPPAPFLARYVKFPRGQDEIHQRQAEFREIANFPGVVGTIDGTHIRIVAPKEYVAEYINRENYHSLNVQLVFDASYRVLNVVGKWPGSVRDSRIWNECGLKQGFANGTVPAGCHLIGDNKWIPMPTMAVDSIPPTQE